ncbi:MAG: amidohydrolase [Candidatus Ancillula sp.]|jgi:5-methylthioadenosine/S-adenosylhomocysteine deaminase|nr:amidohydrolase [Candidatus Ancillula sp.]
MILLDNARIVQSDGQCVDGFVCINGSYITQVGVSGARLPDDLQSYERIDLQHNLLIPGLVNAHTHSAMTLFAGASDDLALKEWLFDKIFPLEAKLTPEDVYWASKLAGLEYLSCGTTTVFDMYFHSTETMRALNEMGVRTVLCGSLNDFGGNVKDFDDAFQKYGDSAESLAGFRAGIHAEYTTSLEMIREVARYVQAHEKPFFTHCSETQKEVQECIDKYGKSPVRLFTDEGLFEHGGGIFHGVHLDNADREALHRHGVGVVTCPSSNLKLASGICEVQKLLDAGVRVGMGTDGPASNNALSMQREMFLASVLQKNLLQDTTVLPAQKTLEIATSSSAEIIGVNSGSITPGKLADLCVVKLDAPNMILNSPVNNLVYSSDKHDILMTIVAGKVLYKAGEYMIPDDVDEIYRNCRKIHQRIMV